MKLERKTIANPALGDPVSQRDASPVFKPRSPLQTRRKWPVLTRLVILALGTVLSWVIVFKILDILL